MRVVLVVVLLAACGGTPRGPAWPKDRTPETDGGESIAPRPTTAVLDDGHDEIELDFGITPSVEKDKPIGEKKPETPTGVTPGTSTTPDPIIITDEIVIEIED